MSFDAPIGSTGLPQTYLESRWRSARLTLLSLGFCAIGYFMATSGKDEAERIMGWVVIAFFGLCGAAIGISLLSPSSLTIDRDHLTIRTFLKSREYNFRDIGGFGIMSMRGSQMIGFNFTNDYKLAHPLKIYAVNRTLAGFDAALGNRFGWKIGELVTYLEELRRQNVR